MSHDLAGIAADLRGARAAWGALPVDERRRVLERWTDEIRARRPDLVAGLVRDTGRVALSEMEVDAVLSSVDRQGAWAAEILGEPAERLSSDGSVLISQRPEPLGLVGVISPWNFPLQLAMIDAVPALLAGCAVIVKPSELTPEFVPVLRATIEAVPELAAVLQLVEGGPEVGRALVGEVDAVCFTGSVRTGRAVAVAAAEAFVPAFLELGGKDAALVAADADLDIASSGILWGSTANTGQSCMSLERVYVHRDVADDFVERLVAKAQRVRLELPGQPGHVGPFIDPRQADVVVAQLEDARARGAQIRCGGEIEEHDGRRFMRPTVVTGADHSMAVMTEETFGPVIAVMVVDDMEDAVRLANDTPYGLSGAVFGEREAAQRLAARFEAGGISVNDVCLTGMVPEGEKQAFKSSGMGPSRMGPASVRRFLRQRLVLTREDPAKQPWWYPY